MNMKIRFKLSILAVAAMSLLSCSSTRYVSLKPELDAAFQWLSYDEIVGLMGREPDSVLDLEGGGQALVYNAVSEDEYFRSTFGTDRRMMDASKMYLKLLMNENDVCYSVESNIIRREDRFDKEKTKNTVSNIIENILSIFANSLDRIGPRPSL